MPLIFNVVHCMKHYWMPGQYVFYGDLAHETGRATYIY